METFTTAHGDVQCIKARLCEVWELNDFAVDCRDMWSTLVAKYCNHFINTVDADVCNTIAETNGLVDLKQPTGYWVVGVQVPWLVDVLRTRCVTAAMPRATKKTSDLHGTLASLYTDQFRWDILKSTTVFLLAVRLYRQLDGKPSYPWELSQGRRLAPDNPFVKGHPALTLPGQEGPLRLLFPCQGQHGSHPRGEGNGGPTPVNPPLR
uniref:Uncharacterized protein n=1 Tax=Timema cristinae TaxID=61476 RepID=A0A7R9D8K1_TIMCR|nr:unnamed protein product [Timema cristinae]